MELPAFLDKRDPNWLDTLKTRQSNEVKVHRGSLIRMPSFRVNPANAIKSQSVRLDPTSKRVLPKSDKPAYPTTIALKEATADATPEEKRKLNYKIARENGIDPHNWDHLNNGQVSMNLGNTLRGRYYKQKAITILGKEIP